jgi:hypothetical protein
VGDALRDDAGGDQVGDARAIGGAGAGEGDFRRRPPRRGRRCPRRWRLQRLSRLGVWWKSGNRFMQAPAAEGGGEFLELAEGAAA